MTDLIEDAPAASPKGSTVWHRLYHGETRYDFWGKRWRGFGLSLVIIVVSLFSLGFRGLNLGIDFEGGVAWRLPLSETFTTDDAKSVLEANGIDPSNAEVQVYTDGSDRDVRLEVAEQPVEVQTKIAQDLAAKAGIDVTNVSVTSVSSSWGRSITEKAARALVVFLILVMLYISWRLEWRMAVAAIVAVVHDVGISVGIYSVLGFEVTPATVIAFLTILGFSLYDTIVVFDKVHEVEERFKGRRLPYADVVNVATNNVLMRSINTSIAAVLPVLSLLILGAGILGATTLREFALALFVGLFAGSYSSLFIAAPLTGVLKNRDPRWKPFANVKHHTGLELERLVVATTSSALAMPTGAVASDGSVAPAVRQPSGPALSHPPRPRKKKRR
jgi:preprotein translocase subunit SecF